MNSRTERANASSRALLFPEMVTLLRGMHAKARSVRGFTPAGHPDRRCSEDLSYLLAVLVKQGVPMSDIDSALGVHVGATRLRLVRHGYQQGVSPPGTKPYGTPHVRSRSSGNALAVDIAGQTFGRLTAVAATGETSPLGRLWRFTCSCGTETVAAAAQVRAGKVRSCGCARRRSAVQD